MIVVTNLCLRQLSYQRYDDLLVWELSNCSALSVSDHGFEVGADSCTAASSVYCQTTSHVTNSLLSVGAMATLDWDVIAVGDLSRFVQAQESAYKRALAEVRSGR